MTKLKIRSLILITITTNRNKNVKLQKNGSKKLQNSSRSGSGVQLLIKVPI